MFCPPRIWAQASFRCRSVQRTKAPIKCIARTFATHNMDFGNTQSSLLNESAKARRRADPKHDHAGPFQLGLSPSTLRQGEKVPKWSDLSTGGKVMRTTARTTNFGVIMLGAGLSALLVYSLTSELFSKNSPTVIYGEACERIQQSPRVAKYLNAPLTFHNNPPSAVRPRHRNRHVTSRVMVDQQGREHMILTFYVEGRPERESLSQSEGSYLDFASNWLHSKTANLSSFSFDDMVDWTRDITTHLKDKFVRSFKYLSGAPLPSPMIPPLPQEEDRTDRDQSRSKSWGFAGIFSALRPSKTMSTETTYGTSGHQYTKGEVHADLVKNADGYFVFRYLLVDIPNSRDPHPLRIFVERDAGVRENEPVVRWISS